MTIFKLIFFISLITNALNACAGKNQGDCQKDNACQWDDEVIQKCSPITNVLTTECDANKATEDACKGIVSGDTKLCSFTKGESTNTCEHDVSAISGLCGTDEAKSK